MDERGSGLEDEYIEILEDKYKDDIINTKELSTRGNKDKTVIRFNKIVDEIPELDAKKDVLTWKRMAMVLLKNDYWCKTLSFGITKQQLQRRNEIIKKYQNLL